jgi:hypothetical protein
MGTDWYSYAVIGFEIDVETLYTTKKVRNCSCSIEFDESKPPRFCIECGSPFMKDSKWPIDGFDEDEKLGDMRIVFGTDRKTAFIGELISSTSSHKCFRGDEEGSFKRIETDVETMRQNIEKALGKELFEAVVYTETFGLHSVLCCSY